VAAISFGRLRGENRYEPLADGRLRAGTRVDLHGPLGSLFHLIWESRRRADMHKKLRRPGGQSGPAWLSGSEGEPASPFGKRVGQPVRH
jgi:hypothetical protein